MLNASYTLTTILKALQALDVNLTTTPRGKCNFNPHYRLIRALRHTANRWWLWGLEPKGGTSVPASLAAHRLEPARDRPSVTGVWAHVLSRSLHGTLTSLCVFISAPLIFFPVFMGHL